MLTKLIVVVLVATLGAYGYNHYRKRVAQIPQTLPQRAEPAPMEARTPAPLEVKPSAPALPTFRCDGRTYCSQMTSCTEAKFFLQNCPGTKMDGNHDGIPCEQQWCTSPLAK